MARFDQAWHRVLDWTAGQTPSQWHHVENKVILIPRELCDTVTVTYTGAAHVYSTFFEGELIVLPVEHADMLDAVPEALNANKEDAATQ